MRVAITGGAGFIGSNAVARFCSAGHEILVVDNLSRPSSEENLADLQKGHKFEFLEADLANEGSFNDTFSRFQPETVLHLAGQVAVTTSVSDPRLDFEGNILSTFNLLEACRRLESPPFFIFASTNKVYGNLQNVPVTEMALRYEYDASFRGVTEEMPLEFHSPYGCSKGAADQYVLEYSRTFGIPAAVFRQSCIYGPHQFGIEDQGWVAWFMAASRLGKQVTVFGDGKQVRDILHVDDLLNAYERAIANPAKSAGQAFNIGGGAQNTLSVLELIDHINRLQGMDLKPEFGPWRPSDQKVFISDISKVSESLGWEPKISVREGMLELDSWVRANIEVIKTHLG